jgi:hypothetical protein
LRILLTISLLAVLLFKISEPMVVALRYENAKDVAASDLVNTEEQIELKVYMPLPYGSDWENKSPFPESIKRGNNFYNVVERRYVNDTFYVKMQLNHNAREQFDALSVAVNSLLSDENQDKQESPKTATISLDDLIKIFPPPVSSTIVKANYASQSDLTASVWYVNCPLSTANSSIFIPPPERV